MPETKKKSPATAGFRTVLHARVKHLVHLAVQSIGRTVVFGIITSVPVC